MFTVSFIGTQQVTRELNGTLFVCLPNLMPALQSAVRVQRATILSAAVLTSLFLSCSTGTQQWQETLHDEELCLLLSVLYRPTVIITLQ